MYNEPGIEKAICTAYHVPFHVQGWKALENAPSNTFLSRRLLSGIQVADFAAQPRAKLPAGWGVKVWLWLCCAKGSPLFMAFPDPGLPSIEK